MRHTLRSGLVVLCFLAVASCGGVPVEEVRMPLASAAFNKGALIMVAPGNSSGTVFQGDYSDDPASVEAWRVVLRDIYAIKLASVLQEYGYNAQVYQEPVPPNAFIVQIVPRTFDGGSNAARLLVGFGAGASYLVTDFKVFQGQSMVSDFSTDVSSGASGGWASLGDWMGVFINDSAYQVADYFDYVQGL